MTKARRKVLITAAQSCYYKNKEGDQLPWGGGKGKAIPHTNLINGFEEIAERVGAELIIVPIAGKRTNENILHSDLASRDDIFMGELIRLNKNIQFRNLVSPPQNVDPTTGKARDVSKYGSSIIMPHSKQRYTPVAVHNSEIPNYIYSTGCVTKPNYSSSNSRGDQARRDHVFGGLLVEVIDDVFYNLRNLRAQKNGKFVDLGVLYDGHKTPKKIGTDSLILGDIHWGDHDPDTIAANYEMIDFFKPENLILHDFFNGHSVNHHESDNHLLRARAFRRGRLSLEQELEEDYKELIRLSRAMGPKRNIYLVASNHHDFLPRYINDTQKWSQHDLWNAEIGSYLYNKAVKLSIPEEEIDDASYLIEEGFKRFGKIPLNVTFLRLKDNFRRWGYQLASHGDKGKNGGRGGGARAREVTGGGKSVSAHSHTMEVFGDTYIVGTSSKLKLPYTFGSAGAQIAANDVLYKNGLNQIIPIIGGKWRAD